MTVHFRTSMRCLPACTLAVLLLAFPVLADHTPPPAGVAVAGSLQSELGCPGEWQPECVASELALDVGEGVWQQVFQVPAGNWEYKAALNDTWDENYGAGGIANGSNIALDLVAPTAVKFYYDHRSHWITDNVNSVIATVAGSFQSELGCPGDWQPDCLRSWLQDADGDGIYTFGTAALPPGDYEFKVALNESWDESYPAGNLAFSISEGALFTVEFDSADNSVRFNVDGGIDPGDAALVAPPVRANISHESFYFLLPDRFDNGDASNDAGGDASGDPLVNGLLPHNSGYYHGGDLAGLMGQLDYLQELGISAVWITPQFTNRWVQGDGTIGGSSAAYHGYWQTDYTQIDPHFGTNTEMQALIAAAHAWGMKVFFDVVINHTGDVITYAEGSFTYRSKTDYPYQDASGAVFDDRDFVDTGTFPALDPAVSFPYAPVFDSPALASVKNPAWLNDPVYYHNRGDSTFSGENSLYGDFFGLDDLFTEHPDVVDGMIAIHQNMISEFRIDGFRIDTVKHVNDEFWKAFVPAIQAHAAAEGIPEFFMFGEVFDGDPAFLSRFTNELLLPAVLDFGFQGAATRFVAGNAATDDLAAFFASDDYYTDPDSNAHQLIKFLSNHDIGRLAYAVDAGNPGAADAERAARVALGHALMVFSRGVPLIYYGDEQGFVGDGGDKDARQDMMPSLVATYNDDDLIGTAATTADDNFDRTHPLYEAFADLNQLRDTHEALRQGAQIQRFSTGAAGIIAFSRIHRDEQVEYLAVLNNSESMQSASFHTDTANTSFTQIYPGTGPALPSAADGGVMVEIPGLSYALYRAQNPVPAPAFSPAVVISAPAAAAAVNGRVEVAADVSADGPAEVTFVVSADGGASYQLIGSDDNAPYRVFHEVDQYGAGAALIFKAIVSDLAGTLRSASAMVSVGSGGGGSDANVPYAIIHYARDDGDYGDHTTGDYNDFWGLHLWEDIDEVIEWTAPKPFLGEDDFGRFGWVKVQPGATNVGLIVHRGDTKDGTDDDRFFNPSVTPEIWLRNDDPNIYATQAAAQGYVTVRYHRDDGDYGDPTSSDYTDFWGLHIWGDAADPGELTEWTSPKPPTGFDDYGAFWNIPIQDASQSLNYIIHRGDDKDPGPDQGFIPEQDAGVWIQSGDPQIYTSRAAAENVAVVHYHRPDGDYGDSSSPDFNDFWGLHVWTGAASPNPAWQDPVRWQEVDTFGPAFSVPLVDGATQLSYIIHRGDAKDPGPDQELIFAANGYEVWQLTGSNPENPYLLPVSRVAGGGNPGNIGEQRAYWVNEDIILWAEEGAASYHLHFSATGGLSTTAEGISGGLSIPLTPVPGGLPAAAAEKFPHLAALPALQIDPADLELVPDILRGQIAVSALDGNDMSINATGLQIPGVLDDLYGYSGELGAGWDGGQPTLRLWAPTAQAVSLHLLDDSDSTNPAVILPMTLGLESGVWSVEGDASWKGKYYLYEVAVYVHSTGQVERNLVTDPYSLSLSSNSTRSQIIDLGDPALSPPGWDAVQKPDLPAPEDISIYEIHVRDFSASDPLVPEALQGTYKAFTLMGTHGTNHLRDLANAGLSHLHLLPVFDITTVDEDRANWQAPDPAVLAGLPPDSPDQQAMVASTQQLDGFNWGYDPFHYTTPEGSYATDPDGALRILEFREMVQSINRMGMRVVMDVVYNHTSAAGQSDKSVLDRIVPGYYHRLDDTGAVATSTCCANTASEHDMMEKLMVDSLVTWAKQYKVDAFRFDLMGHHMLRNMQAVRSALDTLTLEQDGVDGASIYVYGEGWNFGEVADNARGVNATQLNVAGTGIGTFNDRLRDALRGGGPFDGGDSLIRNQGFANGLYYDPNALNSGAPDELAQLLLSSDQIRVGMAGNLADFRFIDRNGDKVAGSEVDYNGTPAGYTRDPQEDITYISKHDNQTLFDNNAYKIPQVASMEARVRAQNVGLSVVLLGQGVPFLHAGSELLRSKSMDRDSFDSGDWFNRLDFTYQDNNFGAGLPIAGKNQDNWPVMAPLLGDPTLKPLPADIAFSRQLVIEFLQIRYSSSLFRLTTDQEVQDRVDFLNTGPGQIPGLIVMSLSDHGGAVDRSRQQIVTLVNANDEGASFSLAGGAGLAFALHPVQAASVDPVVQTAAFDAATGEFTVPGRTTAVFVLMRSVREQIELLQADLGQLAADGKLPKPLSRVLPDLLKLAKKFDRKGKSKQAIRFMQNFIRTVEQSVRRGRLTETDGEALAVAAEDILDALRRSSQTAHRVEKPRSKQHGWH